MLDGICSERRNQEGLCAMKELDVHSAYPRRVARAVECGDCRLAHRGGPEGETERLIGWYRGPWGVCMGAGLLEEEARYKDGRESMPTRSLNALTICVYYRSSIAK